MTKFFFIVLSILLFSCKQTAIRKVETGFVKYPSSGKLDSFTLHYLRESEDYVYLPSIENGSDSLEIRIFIQPLLSSYCDLFVIKSSKDSLVKKHYYFTSGDRYKPDSTLESNEGQFSFMHNFYFTKGDSTFQKFYNKARIDTLPTQYLIPNLKGGCLDGVAYVIEIADKNMYRFLTYGNPRCYPGSRQNQIFSEFMSNFFSILPNDEMAWFYSNKNQNKFQQ